MANTSNLLSDLGINIFISYRRADSEGYAGRLYDWLCQQFDEERIFMDIDAIRGGDDFISSIENALASCKILIAVIGKRWNITKGNKRLLDNEKDFVRLEIATALKRGIKIIPLLVEKAQIPLEEELPDVIKPLLRKQIIELRHDQWKNDLNRLISVIKDELNKKPYPTVSVDTDQIGLPPIQTDYIVDAGLHNAISVALSLRKPLLISGEAGVGKSLVAYKIAQELQAQPLVYNFNSNSKAQDILYSFEETGSTTMYGREYLKSQIKLGALGLAILLTLDKKEVADFLPEHWRGIGPKQSVVFLNQIDRAPYDVAIDIVPKMELLELQIKELNTYFIAEKQYSPILVITTNNERDLPEELRNFCIFYEIPFPSKEHLIALTRNYLKADNPIEVELVNTLLDHYLNIRNLGLTKKPTIKEYLEWVKYIFANKIRNIDFRNLTADQARIVDASYSILAKHGEDLRTLFAFTY